MAHGELERRQHHVELKVQRSLALGARARRRLLLARVQVEKARDPQGTVAVCG